MSTPPLAVPPSSLRVRSTSAAPLASAASVKVRSPVAGSTAGPALNRPGLLLATTLKVRDCGYTGGPAGERVRPRILVNRLVRTVVEIGLVVDAGNGDRKGLVC